jgi:hypothetical protein
MELDMSTDRVMCISITCKQGKNTSCRRVYLDDQPTQEITNGEGSNLFTVSSQSQSMRGRTMNGFRDWIKQNILTVLEDVQDHESY